MISLTPLEVALNALTLALKDSAHAFVLLLMKNGTTYQYRQVDVNTGLLYEHILPGSITLSLRAGVRINPYARTFEKDRSFRDYTWEGRADAAPYLNIGFSFNPFAKPKK